MMKKENFIKFCENGYFAGVVVRVFDTLYKNSDNQFSTTLSDEIWSQYFVAEEMLRTTSGVNSECMYDVLKTIQRHTELNDPFYGVWHEIKVIVDNLGYYAAKAGLCTFDEQLNV